MTDFDFQPQFESFVVIRTYSSIAEARVAQATLESFDIEAQLSDEATIGLEWAYSAALGGVKLLVKNDEVLWALHYLGQDATPLPEAVEFDSFDDDDDTPICPSCGGSRVYPIETRRKIGVSLALASIVGISFFLAPLFKSFRSLVSSTYECRQCSRRF